MTPGRLGKNLH